MNLSSLEQTNGRLAASVVAQAGGYLSFDDYDSAMKDRLYFYPITWIAGWGDRARWKANNDKLCASAAVAMGLLVQTEDGYHTVHHGTLQ
jgi:hypothetical protein